MDDSITSLQIHLYWAFVCSQFRQALDHWTILQPLNEFIAETQSRLLKLREAFPDLYRKAKDMNIQNENTGKREQTCNPSPWEVEGVGLEGQGEAAR